MKKYFLMLSVVAVLAVASGVHAATLDQVISKMNAYRAQNAANPAVLGAYAAGATTSEGYQALPPQQSAEIVNDLRNVTGKLVQPIVTKQVCKGSTDTANVKALQALLAAKGYLDPTLITGTFGVKTATALGAFQKNAGITGTGVGKCVGAQTMKILGVAY